MSKTLEEVQQRVSIRSFVGPDPTTPDEQYSAQDLAMFASIHEVRQAMDLFLNSRTAECEALLLPKRDASMYHSLGYAFILSLKAVLTYQRTDIEAALDAMKQAYQVADKLRKGDASWKSLITTYSVQELKEMTPLQRHAVRMCGWIPIVARYK